MDQGWKKERQVRINFWSSQFGVRTLQKLIVEGHISNKLVSEKVAEAEEELRHDLNTGMLDFNGYPTPTSPDILLYSLREAKNRFGFLVTSSIEPNMITRLVVRLRDLF